MKSNYLSKYFKLFSPFTCSFKFLAYLYLMLSYNSFIIILYMESSSVTDPCGKSAQNLPNKVFFFKAITIYLICRHLLNYMWTSCGKSTQVGCNFFLVNGLLGNSNVGVNLNYILWIVPFQINSSILAVWRSPNTRK